jgi:hypothetical protein
LRQKHAKEAKLQREKHAKEVGRQQRRYAREEQKGSLLSGDIIAKGGTNRYIGGSADNNASNPSTPTPTTSTAYPKLGDRDFTKCSIVDINRIISECTTDQQRAEVLKLWDAGYRTVGVPLS